MPIYLLDRREIKNEAKSLLHTARVSPLRMTALFLVIDLALNEISTVIDYMLPAPFDAASFSFNFSTESLPFSFLSILIGLLSTVLLAGYTCYTLGVSRGDSMPYESLFDAFPFAGRVILLELLQFLLIGAGLALFILPGFYLALVYAFSLYHLCENPDAGVFDAMRRSREETRGYRGQLCTLLLSFLPLLLLVSVPVGVCEYLMQNMFPGTLAGSLLHTLVSGVLTACASLYITPYMALAQIGFYRRVTAPRAPAAGPSDGGFPEP